MSETPPSPRPGGPEPPLLLRAPGSRPSLPADDPTPSPDPLSPSPSSETSPQQLDPTAPTSSLGGSWDGSGPGEAERSTSSTRRSSSPTSTDGAQGELLGVDPTLIAEKLTDAVGAAAQLANDRFAPGTDLYLTLPPEERGLAEPLANAIARRIPRYLLGGAGKNDAEDAIAAAMTLGSYLMRQVRLRLEYRRRRRAAQSPVDASLNGDAA